MSMFGNNGFDANAEENNQVRDLIPKGEYPAVLVNAVQKDTKDGKGKYLSMDFQIVRGQFQNKHVFENLNIWLAETDEKKKTAVQIAKAKLSELCKMTNVLNPKDPSEFYGKEVVLKLDVRESDGYGKQNVIKGFKSKAFNATVATPPKQEQEAVTVSDDANPFG